MTVHRHLCIVVGNWKLENWRMYRLQPHSDAKTGKTKWTMWDRVTVLGILMLLAGCASEPYIAVGVAAQDHGSPEPVSCYCYYTFDINHTVNPYGLVQIGAITPLRPSLDLDLRITHSSSIPAKDYGQNRAEVLLRWTMKRTTGTP